MNKIPHLPVLLDEVCDSFKSLSDFDIFIDCTLGYGGHSEAILKMLPNIKLIAIDQDDEALNFAKDRLKQFESRVEFKKGRFSDVVKSLDVPIAGLLADIGVSSLHLDKDDRGFGFYSTELDMRMDKNSHEISAKDVLNSYDLLSLEKIFRDFGEIREYKKLAKLITEYRKTKKFESCYEFSNLIEKHFKKQKIHPATLAFQAIRIEVNQELQELEELLKTLEQKKPKNAVIAIISFHSLEDRVVKNYFKKWSSDCICDENVYKCECGNNNSLGEVITKKPLTATDSEIKQNARSRSAKLRVFKFHGN
ncbi:MAG: 16S rRNA (cytosine(1402)-N(4))-methyltransferase RsmH [Campylobacterales bacterium]|nr:16S rRNA (cytosine(1402)-N(4))-methyltransferase RsmH [Campylobacterales bacterium]